MGGRATVGDCPVVFVSYSREDEKWRRRFTEMLKPLVRERRLDVWSDDRTVVGYEWRPQVADAIVRSRLALLLVSPSFLASDFIMDQELPALIGRGVRLVPVLVRPCLWQAVPVLEGLQWAHDPRRDGPVAGSADREGQIVRVCLVLSGLLAAMPAPSGSALTSPAPGRAEPLAAGGRLGDLHDVPPPPHAQVAREELAGLRAAVLAAGDGVVGVTGAALGLHGQGGIGKTVLAGTLARDEDIRRHFPDGVFWVTVGEQGDLVAAQIGLLARLGTAQPELRSAGQGAGLLRRALADRRCLLVVDDVWSAAGVAAFRAVGPRGRVLYTTRDPAVLDGVASKVVQLGVLPLAVARELLCGLTGVEVLPAEADRICAATGGVALAVALVGAAIGAGGRSWQQAAAQLEAEGRTFLDHPYANTFKAMQVGIAALGEDDALAYRSLAVYPEDTVIPVAAVSRLWSHLSGTSAQDTGARLEKLAGRSLLTVQDDGVRFHDLQREFLLLHIEELTLAHADLLAAYRALLPPGASWARLPLDEPYIWDNLVYHLRAAGDGAAIRAVVCDLAWIAMRSFRGGPYPAETDLRLAVRLYPEHAGIGWLLRLLTQWGHLFTQHATVEDLAATLASRVHDAPDPIDAEKLRALLPLCYLVPQWGLPSAQPGLARVLEGHTSWVTSMVFSPDGRLLAGVGYDGTVRLWDPATGQPAATLEGPGIGIHSVVFSPDGRLLVGGGIDGTVRLWDADTGQPAATLEGHTSRVTSVVFSPDGQLLASTGDRTVRLWDLATCQPAATLEGHGSGVMSVVFSPDGRLLAGFDYDGTVRLWDPATGQPAATLEGHSMGRGIVVFSPDGQLLASIGGGYDGTVRLWDPATGQPAATLEGHTSQVRSVVFSPDGQLLASAGQDGTVRLWDPDTGQPAATLDGHAGTVHSVVFSPDGQLLASAGEDGTVRLWDSATGQPAAILEGHGIGVYSVVFSPDGQLLASAAEDGTVRLWDPATGIGQPAAVLQGHQGTAMYSLVFSPDGQLLASGGGDGTVRLWDPATGQPTATLEGHTSRVTSVAFSPDGRLLASAGGTVRLCDPATGQPTATLEGYGGVVTDVVFSPDGRLLASVGYLHRVQLWASATGRPVATLEGYQGITVNSVVFSPDGQLLASAADDGTVRLWDPATGQPTATLEGHTGRVTRVVFSPDGQLLASAAADGTVRLWDPATGQPTATLEGHTGRVTRVVFSPDGQLLASAAADGTVRLWDPATGQPTATLEGHTGWVRSVVFSSDGQLLASADDIGTVRLWDACTPALVSQLKTGLPAAAIAWGPQGITVAGRQGLLHLAIVDRADQAIHGDGERR